ncbi:hypothetical protein Dimus_016293 [Dionaea muscipula]
MGPTTRVTRKIMQRLPWRHELACLSRSMTKTSMLTGHAIQRIVKTDGKRCRKIAQPKEEGDFDASVESSNNMKSDVEMITQENHMLERKNEGLQTLLEKEKEWRKKAKEEVVTLTARINGLRTKKMELDSSLKLKTKENKKMQTELNKARLSLAQVVTPETRMLPAITCGVSHGSLKP